MRKSTIGSALIGSLAIAALLAPGAQADEVGNADVGAFQITGGGGTGNDVVLGTTDSRKITVKLTASDDSGISIADFTLYHGSSLGNADAILKASEQTPVCTADGTSSVCTKHYTIDPRRDLNNSLAGIWKVAVDVRAKDGDYVKSDGHTTFFMKRYSKLTANASPEPVAKGGTITVTGKLTRANWDTHDYRGYANQRTSLQFRRPGTDYYESLGYTATNTYGVLNIKVTASADRYWRYNFTGTMTTRGAKATGDFVDVR
ncbi:calcium-binding protein [Streptomyces coeruleorubidus]|uniref:calcium-binding protein n=1 Tax=Streptomyces coeruleorubidus TaxID=116188 RepID=UPI00237F048B|nr:calcium-binding protein [Streptomyces coeruleorubidus]WDV53312.1 calcium-binding protein [Streptomyces coeruleorubidus]